MNNTEALSRKKKTKLQMVYGKSYQILLVVVLIALVIVPLIIMLTNINEKSFTQVFSDGSFVPALLNSLGTTIIATIISILLAYGLAWAFTKANIKFKSFFKTLLLLPMLIPSIAHGMGLIIIFGNNGLITRLFSAQSSLYGFGGIILGSVLYSFPVAFLMFVDILKYEDCTPYEAAEVLGIPKFRQFTSITLPYLRKPLISIVFTVFTMIITDYGVPLAVGGTTKTLPVLLYENAVGQLNYSAGALIGLMLLIPAVIAFLVDLFNKDKAKSSYVTKSEQAKPNKWKTIAAYTLISATSLFVLLIVVSFCIQAFSTSYPNNMTFTFKHIVDLFNNNGWKYLDNSIFMSLCTAFFGMILAFVTAYSTSRLKTKFSQLLHVMSIISLAIPGLVLGLSYVITFKTSFIYGTFIVLILVNMVHFFASPYLMLYNAMSKINENLESAGQVLNVPRYRVIFDVIIPQCKYTLLEVFSYFFVNSMMTISAVSFLASRNTKPLSLMINQFETFNMMESAAAVALMILLVNLLMKLIIHIIKKRRGKYVNKKSV